MTSAHDNFFDSLADRFRFARHSEADYRTLGVSETASDAEIEQAYLHLIAQQHPDRLVGLARELRRQAEKKARGINAAYGRIRVRRKRDAQRTSAHEASRAATATPEDRRNTGNLLWVTMALIVLVMVAWLASMREPWATASPQAQAPDASVAGMPTSSLPSSSGPASSPVAAPHEPSLPLPVAANGEDRRPVDQLVVLMPKDSPPAPQAPPAPPALSGEAALVEALRAGQLRPATGGDFSRWAQRWSEVNRRGMPTGLQERRGFMTSYVIQKDFTIPDGLTGAHAVIFLLDAGAPYPHGNPGHSVVLDLSTGACMGPTCGMLLD
jgi:DnaJ domain